MTTSSTDTATENETANFAAIVIESIHLRHFRGISECELLLEPDLTLLVGMNNSGKSRILRAIAVALSAVQTDKDDLTSGSDEEAIIDIVIAPAPSEGPDEFDDRTSRRLGTWVQRTGQSPVHERAAWRTTIRPSQEGFGARDTHTQLTWDVGGQQWQSPPTPTVMSMDQRSLIASMLIETRRDVVEEMNQRSSAIRRLLDDLEIEATKREELERNLDDLGADIVSASIVLRSMVTNLETLNASISSVGNPRVTALPGRLENLSQAIAIEYDTGLGHIPMRLQGAGSRSLTSLQIQNLMYHRRLGRDGPALRPHPVTLIEEPEAHLHPQAQFELPGLVNTMVGQKILTTHSAHIASVVDPRCIRLVRPVDDRIAIKDLRSFTRRKGETPGATPGAGLGELERLKRSVERPFGELLFATAVVIGDGATERGFFPSVIREALGQISHGVTVVDPGGLNSPHAIAILKFAIALDMPWAIFSDSDEQGHRAVGALLEIAGSEYGSRVVFVRGQASGSEVHAIEKMLIEYDSDLCERACRALGFDPSTDDLFDFMCQNKGTTGSLLGLELVNKYPCSPDADSAGWPKPLIELVAILKSQLGRSETPS